MIISIVILISIVIFCYHLALHNFGNGKIFNKIPGPSVIPIIGNSLPFLRGNNVALFYSLREAASQFKKGYRIWIFNQKFVNIVDPDDIEILLTSSKHITKGAAYDLLISWLNDGLLISTGKKWQTRRKILTPTFHFNILTQFVTIFVEHSKKMVEKLKLEVANKETSIQPYLTKVALHSICETAMGTNLDSESKSTNDYVSSVYSFIDYFLYRMGRSWLYSEFLFSLTNIGKLNKKAVDTMHRFTTNVIKERRAKRISEDKIEVDKLDDIEVMGTKKRMAMLDLLLSAEADGKINEDGIREEVDTFMFEGHDTTTMAMTFCMMCLANNPEHQEQAFQEINDILGDSKNPSINDFNNMQYLERCIKEALRIYPSVPLIGRILKEDLQLKNFLIPAGTTCTVQILDLHRNKEIFPNPDKFDPDRFLPENCVNRHPFSYIPFSAGPRNCIGQKFAILEMKSIIAHVLHNYKLEAVTRPEDIVFTMDLVLRTANPVKVKFVARKK